jgi:coenzyme F420-reducing hydrogenase delta subunit
MNQKTVKLLKKYADLKGIDKKQIKREWLSMNESEKDVKRQEIVSVLVKK